MYSLIERRNKALLIQKSVHKGLPQTQQVQEASAFANTEAHEDKNGVDSRIITPHSSHEPTWKSTRLPESALHM